ncbi:MAG: 30S ribosome-binding factor RbfA [Oligoflexus sp.]
MSLRRERLADQVRDLLGRCFQGGRLEDPRLQGVTITGAKISPDLQLATVYFRLYEGHDPKEALAGLKAASGFLKRELARGLDLRRVPELRFFLDEGLERASNIEDLLRKL